MFQMEMQNGDLLRSPDTRSSFFGEHQTRIRRAPRLPLPATAAGRRRARAHAQGAQLPGDAPHIREHHLRLGAQRRLLLSFIHASGPSLLFVHLCGVVVVDCFFPSCGGGASFSPHDAFFFPDGTHVWITFSVWSYTFSGRWTCLAVCSPSLFNNMLTKTKQMPVRPICWDPAAWTEKDAHIWVSRYLNPPCSLLAYLARMRLGGGGDT